MFNQIPHIFKLLSLFVRINLQPSLTRKVGKYDIITPNPIVLNNQTSPQVFHKDWD